MGKCFSGLWKALDDFEEDNIMRISRQPSPVTIMIGQKQLENVKYFMYLGSILTNDGRCTREIKSRIAMVKLHSSRRRLFLLTNWT
jgi:hypothetical protein